MPYQSNAQIIGDEGELWFQTQLPQGWLLQKPTRDVGIDGVVVICERGNLNGREFRIQIKSSKKLRFKNSKIILDNSPVKRSTVDYWFISPLPTMIIAYETMTKTGYFCWHSDLFDDLSELRDTTTPVDIVLRIPEQRLMPESWNKIRENLFWHYRNLLYSLQEARNAKSLLPTIHSLAGAVRQLNSIDHQSIPVDQRTQEQEHLLAFMEIFQHRDVLIALTDLLLELHPACDGAKQLNEWISSYRSMVTSVFRSFDSLPEGDFIPPDYHLVYARTLIHSVRPKLIQSALEFIMQLTPSKDKEGPINSNKDQGNKSHGI